MKHIDQKLWMVMAMLCLSISVSAYDFEVDGIRYNVLSHVDFTVETTISPDVIIGEDGILAIPEIVRYGAKELKVVKIGDESFMSNIDIKDVQIPNGVESIGEYAFCDCSNLLAVSAENVRIVSSHAFDGCTDLTDLSLGEIISEIKEYSFASCTSLTNFEYDKNIHTIGEYAFSNSGLEHFQFREDILTIGEYAFCDCKNLKSLEFQKDNFELSVGMFKGCLNLTNLINFSVPSIIPEFCFQNCTALNIDIFLDSSTLETIRSYSLSGCTYPETLILKSNIKSLEDCVFEGFEGNLEIEDSYNTVNITNKSFSGMNIVKLRLGRNLSTWNFHFPSSLTSLNVGTCVSEIAPKIEIYPGNSYYNGYTYGGAPFVECINLEYVEIESTSSPLFISGVGKQIDYSHTGGDYKNWYYNYSYSGVFSECPIKELKILRPITTDFGTSYTFKRSSKYYDYTTYEWQDPFHGVSSTNSLMVDYNAFEFAPISSSLKNLSIDFYVSNIPDLTLCDIENIYIKTPFPPIAEGFSSKTYMDCCLNIPPEEKKEYETQEIWSNFWNITETPSLLCCIKNNGLLYHIVEDNQLALIKDKTLYSGEISIPEEIDYNGNLYIVSGIEKNAFNGCVDLRSLKISGSIIQFGESIFSGCTSLRSLHFDDSENTLSFPIGNYDHTTSTLSKTVNGRTVRFAISYYYGYFSSLPLEELYIGRNLNNDSRYSIAFDGYKYNITSYGAPFNNLPRLKKLIIGENVDILGSNEEFISEVELSETPGTFKNCSALEKVTTKNITPPSGVEFSNSAYSKASLVVPDNTESLYQTADGWKEFLNILGETNAGIEVIRANDSDECISVNEKGIVYTGESIDSIYVYGIDGRLIHSTVVTPNQSISLPNGIYVISIKNKSFKVKI